jgi:uncharacterized protein with GYD domain
MAKYLVQVNYVGEGMKGLLKDGGSKRRAVVEKLFQSMGATIEAFYYAFGDTDLYIIGDFPDHAAGIVAISTTLFGLMYVPWLLNFIQKIQFYT